MTGSWQQTGDPAIAVICTCSGAAIVHTVSGGRYDCTPVAPAQTGCLLRIHLSQELGQRPAISLVTSKQCGAAVAQLDTACGLSRSPVSGCEFQALSLRLVGRISCWFAMMPIMSTCLQLATFSSMSCKRRSSFPRPVPPVTSLNGVCRRIANMDQKTWIATAAA